MTWLLRTAPKCSSTDERSDGFATQLMWGTSFGSMPTAGANFLSSLVE